MSRHAYENKVGLLSAAMILVSWCGCGVGGPPRFDLSGAVTYDGQLVPAGTIEFEPDAAANNAGTPVVARIQDGRYATDEGMGTLGGPHIVRIYGYDGVPNIEGGSPEGAAIFPPYETHVDLPKKPSERDFVVPVEREPVPPQKDSP